MHPLLNCLLLLALPMAWMAAGYCVVARMSPVGAAAERLALSVVVGLCLFIWNVSVCGLFLPIRGLAAWICLWPLAAGLIDRRSRAAFTADLGAVLGNRRGALLLGSMSCFLLTLLWPLFSRPDLVFYEGTSNHDAFFWICGAEYLRDHTYLTLPVPSVLQPLTNGVGVFTGGWLPRWGRMSSEGLLALLAAITGRTALQLYVAATGALFFPWIAAVYLLARTFLIRRFSWLALLMLGLAQPLFIFFHGNSNLPNLLGALSGALVVVAAERCLRPRASDRPHVWVVVFALGLHSLLCSYPELAPFILLPVFFLGARALFAAERSHRRSTLRLLTCGLLAGLVLNPATTTRAASGFYWSFNAIRGDAIWPGLFNSLPAVDYLPALATLTLYTSADLGVVASCLCSLLLVGALSWAGWKARDRFGAFAVLSGAALLLGYTIVARLDYGWQKTAQFAGIFSAALLSVAAVNVFALPPAKVSHRLLARVIVAGLSAFLLYATVRNGYESHKWSQRKAITDDWDAVRVYAQNNLRAAPVWIDAQSFYQPYFHGMWAVYFIAESHPIFSDRATKNGGYLFDYTRTESEAPDEIPQAFLVSGDWARSFDANSPRLVEGEEVMLLASTNRVRELVGFFPQSGVPQRASPDFVIALRPHHSSRLELDLTLPPGAAPLSVQWRITGGLKDETRTFAVLSGPPPWRFSVPLSAEAENQLVFSATGADKAAPFPFTVQRLQVLDSR